MRKVPAFLGLCLILIGIAFIGIAGVQAIAVFNSNAVVNPPAPALIQAIVPALSPSPSAVQEAENLPTGIPQPPTNPPTLTPPILSETPTLPSIATLSVAPLVQPTASSSRPIRIIIPVLNLDATVTEMQQNVVIENGAQVSDWQVPKYDVGHAAGSANPGERGNVVMSAHNNLYTALFRKLYTMKAGDEITLYNAAGRSFLYRAAQSYIVQEVGVSFAQQVANAQVMLPTKDSRLTLISCYPENNNTHRAIVIARLLD